MRKLRSIVDTCTLRYKIKSKDPSGLKGLYILPFQITELSSTDLDWFFQAGGKVEYRQSKLIGDENFIALDPAVYSIITHDKELKRKLKKLSFTVYSNIYQCRNINDENIN